MTNGDCVRASSDEIIADFIIHIIECSTNFTVTDKYREGLIQYLKTEAQFIDDAEDEQI